MNARERLNLPLRLEDIEERAAVNDENPRQASFTYAGYDFHLRYEFDQFEEMGIEDAEGWTRPSILEVNDHEFNFLTVDVNGTEYEFCGSDATGPGGISLSKDLESPQEYRNWDEAYQAFLNMVN